VRALLRDMLCGHLEGDLSALADQLVAKSASATLPRPAPAGQALSDQPTEELAVDEVGLGVDRQ
jgi:hypothetical protein